MPNPRDVHDARGDKIVPGRWRWTFKDGSSEEHIFSAAPGQGRLPLSAWAGIDRAALARMKSLGGGACILVERE